MSESAVERAAVGRRFAGREVGVMLALGLLLLVSVVLSLGLGAVDIPPGSVLHILAAAPFGAESGEANEAVLLGIRLPRVLLGIATGAGLAVAGACLQGLFRNPLADPQLIGISGGAALASASTIVFGGSLIALLPTALAAWVLPGMAFLGALLVTSLVYAIAWRRDGLDIATLLLAGVAINALTMAGLGLLSFLGDDQQLRQLSLWLLGSLAAAPWRQVLPLLPIMLLAVLAMIASARALNAMLLGESEAFHLGFAVETVKRRLVVLCALAAGSAVALTGMIAFVGLVVPHLIRLVLGPDHRTLLPASALLGASLLLLADLVARLTVLPAELPVGVVTAFGGAPFFLWLLLRRRSGGGIL